MDLIDLVIEIDPEYIPDLGHKGTVHFTPTPDPTPERQDRS